MPTPCSVSGTLQTLTSGRIAQGKVIFQLTNTGTGNPIGVSGTSIIPALTYTVMTAQDGSFAVSLWGNDNISPSNTLYAVTFRDFQGNEIGPILYSITGASVSLNSLAVSSGTIPPVLINNAILQNPTVPQTITGQPLTLTSTAPLIVDTESVKKLENIRFADQFASINAAITDAGAGGTVVIPAGIGNQTATITAAFPIRLIILGSFSSTANPIFSFTGVGGVTIEGGGNGSTATTAPTITQTMTGSRIMDVGDPTGVAPFRGLTVSNIRFIASTPSATSTIKLNPNLGSVDFRDVYLNGVTVDGSAGNYAVVVFNSVRADNAVNAAFNFTCTATGGGIGFNNTYANNTTGAGVGFVMSNGDYTLVGTQADNNAKGYQVTGAGTPDVRFISTHSGNSSTSGISIETPGIVTIIDHVGSADQIPIAIASASAHVAIINPHTASTVGANSITVSAASNGDNRLIGTAGLDKVVSVTAGGVLQQTLSSTNGTQGVTIASGTSTLTANATLGATTSQTAITTAATGAATTDSIEWAYASAPGAGDSLCIIQPYVTANNVNFVRSNPTAAAQNVSAIVINWRVIR